jgi:hypothetical protein
MRRRIGRNVRRQVRSLVVGGALLLVSVGMLVAARLLKGFNSDLLLNLGASVVLAAVSYVIFDPIFDEARKARVQEHERFDQDTFIENLRETGRNIRILDTWTILLEPKARAQTLQALRTALENGAEVRVLLLDPDSSAAQQRAEELERRNINVAAQIMANLRHLHEFREQITEPGPRSRLRVSVYDASPSIQLYQWDGRALISFFPIGKVSFDVPQLEVDMASPWGQFVDRRFDEMWAHQDHIRSLDRYWRLAVTLTCGDSRIDTFAVPYVGSDSGHVYVDGTGDLANRLADHLLQARDEPTDGVASFGARAVWPPRLAGVPAQDFDLVRVEERQTPSLAAVVRLFDQKYSHYPEASRREAFILRLQRR